MFNNISHSEKVLQVLKKIQLLPHYFAVASLCYVLRCNLVGAAEETSCCKSVH